MAGKVLILGGLRSGKSRFAVELAARRGRRVLFVATATAGDAEMKRRIELHRKARPPGWRTLEVPREVGQSILRGLGDAEVVVVDCLTLLVSNVMQGGGQAAIRAGQEALGKAVLEEMEWLVKCMEESPADFIVVSNEVGAGIVPVNRLARVYSELLGQANQIVAAKADEVYLMVAGIPVPIKP
ncbi:MAG: bifunctional adenosylcobinamide kinase/adenosylcobinamide-phosphate guanylyltransferase [Dehalococcoidia bacterium]|nr:bifunctional adenosylcobinamide kinase/adenosylcobinamide-phosphate guanylyltransferase [Dehalococcoidia bacterium]